MARRRTKKRTHTGANNGPANEAPTNALGRTPKSMVIRIGAGEVGPSVSQLVKDVRTVMEPGTASRLKERRSNRLRDYTAMAGPLGVSHLLLFSRSATGNVNLRLALAPRGPTLHFRVEQYSLSKDVCKSQNHARDGGRHFATAPLLVMNNFSTPQPESNIGNSAPNTIDSLITTVFQSLFPPISPASTPLSSVRRVLLLNRESIKDSIDPKMDAQSSHIINFRHYSIQTRSSGASRGIKRLKAAEKFNRHQSKMNRGLPNLSKLNDVADYLLESRNSASGFTSGSESEAESDAGVEVLETVPRKVLNKDQISKRRAQGERISLGNNQFVEKRAVKLVELGPRMRLRMTKIEEGVCGGKVMWHEYLSKTDEEIKAMDKMWEQRRLKKEERKKLQKENVERKRRERERSKADGKGIEQADRVENHDMDDSDNDWDSEGFEDGISIEADQEQITVAVG